MNNLYEQNLLEIHAAAKGQELKLRERKLYNRNEVEAIEGKWKGIAASCFVAGLIVACLIIHFFH